MPLEHLTVAYERYDSPMPKEVAARRHDADLPYEVVLSAGATRAQTLSRSPGGTWWVTLHDTAGGARDCLWLTPAPDGTLLVRRHGRHLHGPLPDLGPEEHLALVRSGVMPGWVNLETSGTAPAAAFGDWLPLARFVAELVGGPEHQLAATASLRDAPPPPPRPTGPQGAVTLATTGARVPAQEEIEEAVVEVRDAGTLRLPSGRLVVCDPSTGGSPLLEPLPPGNHPVSVAVLRETGEFGGEVVAAARVALADEPVVTWEPALGPGDDPDLMGGDEIVGFGVDSGHGCFADAGIAFNPDCQWFYDLLDELEQRAATEWTDPTTGSNVIVFHTGLGDGGYPVWLGRTAAGELACVLVDMLVLPPGVP